MSKTLITLDFESYFDQDCTLKKLGTSQYVQHPDFHAHSMSFKTRSMKEAKVLRPRGIKEFFDRLRPIADQVVMCGHHLQFDGYIASYHYDFVPGYYLCTYSMAQPHHNQYSDCSLETLCQYYGIDDGKMKNVLDKWKGKRWEDMSPEDQQEMLAYNALDVELTEKLLEYLLPKSPRFELDVMDLTVRMFNDPKAVINAEKANAVIDEEKEKKKRLAEEAGIDQATARSVDKFAAACEEFGYELPHKWSIKKKKYVPALAKQDLSFQRMYRSADDTLKALLDARLANSSSINETRAKSMIARSKAPVPIYLLYSSAHTFRWGGGDKFNPQNLPRDGRLRACLEAPPGHVFVIADAAQIEARKNAVFCGQTDLVEAFARGEDVYASFASDIYGFPVDKESYPDERFVGKTGILGLGYQCGIDRYQEMLEVGAMGPPKILSYEEAEKTVRTYRSKYPYIRQMWRTLQNMIPCMLPEAKRPTEFNGLVFEPGGTLLMPNGLRMHYPGLDYRIGGFGTPEFFYMAYDKSYKKVIEKKLYGGLLLENIIQSLSRTITAGHAVQLSKRWQMILLVHDEVIMCVPENQAEECLEDAISTMAVPPADWAKGVPLKGEGEISKFYVKP